MDWKNKPIVTPNEIPKNVALARICRSNLFFFIEPLYGISAFNSNVSSCPMACADTDAGVGARLQIAAASTAASATTAANWPLPGRYCAAFQTYDFPLCHPKLIMVNYTAFEKIRAYRHLNHLAAIYPLGPRAFS
jgi:hypothetical protein